MTRENFGNKKSNKARKAEAAAKRNGNQQQQSKKSAVTSNRAKEASNSKNYSLKLVGFFKLNLSTLRSWLSYINIQNT